MVDKLGVEGLSELEKVMEQLPASLNRKVLNAALKKAAAPIVKAARKRIPRDSGDSARNFKARVTPKSQMQWERAGVTISGTKDKKGRDYILRFIEFGTEKMGARPFFRPAIDSKQSEAINIFAKAAWEKLEKEANKLGK